MPRWHLEPRLQHPVYWLSSTRSFQPQCQKVSSNTCTYRGLPYKFRIIPNRIKYPDDSFKEKWQIQPPHRKRHASRDWLQAKEDRKYTSGVDLAHIVEVLQRDGCHWWVPFLPTLTVEHERGLRRHTCYKVWNTEMGIKWPTLCRRRLLFFSKISNFVKFDPKSLIGACKGLATKIHHTDTCGPFY